MCLAHGVISQNLVFLAPQRSENLKNLSKITRSLVYSTRWALYIRSSFTTCYKILPTRTRHPETVTQAFVVKFAIYVYTSHWTNKNVTVSIQASIGPSGEPVSKYHNMGQWAMDSWCWRSRTIRGIPLGILTNSI